MAEKIEKKTFVTRTFIIKKRCQCIGKRFPLKKGGQIKGLEVTFQINYVATSLIIVIHLKKGKN